MLRATGTRYLIEPEEQSKQTASGIILKQSNDTQFAIIRSSGERLKEPLPAGTKVVVEWNHTVPVKHENATYFVVEERSVIAVVEEEQ